MEMFREIRRIESEKIVINVPKTFRKKQVEIIIFPLAKETEESAPTAPDKQEEVEAGGLCGIWQDERDADEIIEDIYSHRTGI